MYVTKMIEIKILDFFEYVFKKTNLSNYTITLYLRVFHIIFPFINGYLLLTGTKKTFLTIVYINIIIFSCFHIFHGCLLSKLEERFTHDDYNIIDPLLELFHIEKNHDERKRISQYSFLVTILLTIYIYNYRFGIDYLN